MANIEIAQEGNQKSSMDGHTPTFKRLNYHSRRGQDQGKPRLKRRKLSGLHLRNHDYSFVPPPTEFKGVPRMNIAVLVVGSRGDVQPFIALGQVLAAPPYNHRVRICTHPNFKDFVEENGLEFYSIGGDPEKLMSYMVRNPGILPTLASVKAGDVGQRRKEMAEMLHGCWRSCIEAGNGIDPIKASHLDIEKDDPGDLFAGLPDTFVADAIISNPPAYANVNIAEKLGIPLHMMFTMPWSPTSAFSQPLANIDQSRHDVKVANYMSFYQVDLLTWQGLSDLINDFREKDLLLDAIDPAWGHMLLPHLKVPFTYFWSPALIPKPRDWHDHITISGFQFLSLASSFKPPADLQAFLDAGPPPVYIGFGSIVVDDPNKLTNMVLEAVKRAGVRALVSKGWGNLGGDDVPDNVFLLGNVPHDWLFPRCSAVVHHGGAGTTAIGIALGKPTVVVPFFGDQPFWGDMVHRAGAGPKAVPYKEMTTEILADSLKQVQGAEMQERAQELAAKIQSEKGSQTAAEQFQRNPQLDNVGCFLCPDRVAVWRVKRTNIRLSALAAAVLIVNGRVKPGGMRLIRQKHWTVEEGVQDPFIGIYATLSTTITGWISDCRQYGRDIRKLQAEVAGGGTTGGKRTKATAKLVGYLAGRTLKAPIDLTYNVANGFHNSPAYLLADRTVRERNHITGIPSGLKTALGGGVNELFDGFTGLVTQPYQSVKRHRAAGDSVGRQAFGAVKGTARGVGALVLKTCAAAVGLPGYTLKGIERECEAWLRGAGQTDEFATEYMARTRAWLERERLARHVGQPHEVQQQIAAQNTFLRKRRGPTAMRRIFGRRVWQSLSELHELGQDGQMLEKVEREILDKWDGLKVPARFV